MTEQKNRRRCPRYPLITEIQYVCNSPLITARITDICAGGMFIDTLNPLVVGATLKFKLKLPEDPPGKPIIGEARVTWKQETVGMGVVFTRMSKEDWDRLQLFVKKLGGDTKP